VEEEEKEKAKETVIHSIQISEEKSMRIYHPLAQILPRLIDLSFKLENSAES
jgi:hypothetical protein